MKRIDKSRELEIVRLRLQGKSIPEISVITGAAKTTVTRYIKGILIPEEYLILLKEKQGGAKERAKGLRENVLAQAKNAVGNISDRDLLFLLIGLYWGEGTKRDFSIINSDPFLIQSFICSLESFGISKARLALSLRVHSDISIPDAKNFWAKTTGLSISRIGRIEVIEGKKKGKLKYGMCRIRVLSGIRERLFIQSAISLIGEVSGKKILSP